MSQQSKPRGDHELSVASQTFALFPVILGLDAGSIRQLLGQRQALSFPPSKATIYFTIEQQLQMC